MTFKVRTGSTIFDTTLERYGDVSLCVKLLLDNRSIIENINSEIDGLELEYDETLKKEIQVPLVTVKAIIKNKAQIYKPRDGQSIFDISLTLNGGYESIISLVKNSSLSNINNRITYQSVFNYTETDNSTLLWIRSTNQVFKTGVSITTGREHNSGFNSLEFT